MEWLGKIIDLLGKPTIWIIGLAFLFVKVAGNRMGIAITNSSILSMWNIIGVICLVAMFLSIIILIYDYFGRKRKRRKEKDNREKTKIFEQKNKIDCLNSLSNEQKILLQRFCEYDQRIMHDYEIGGFHAIWKPDMKVLIHKGIVKPINYSTYEINADYYNIIKEVVGPVQGNEDKYYD